jgi:hypothetical protein
MNAANVLEMARASGLELLVIGGKLASRGPAPPELHTAIGAHKDALIGLLTGVRTWVSWREGDPCPTCGRSEAEHAVDFFGCGLPPPAYEREVVAAGCPRCRFKVFADHATQTGGGAWIHPTCVGGKS